MSLHPTHEAPLAAEYGTSGGAWDVPPLETFFAHRNGLTGPAVVDDTQTLDRTALDAQIARVAGGLVEAGVRPGEVVTWQLPNCTEAFVLYRACWRVGAVAAPVHHLAGSADRAAMLQQVDPALSISGRDLPLGAPITETPARETDLAAVLFTSGSTGRPKGALHTQRAFAYKAQVMAAAHGLTFSDAILMPAPLAHISGLLNGVLLPSVVPMKVVLMAKWNPEHAVELIERERITFMIGPPTFFVALMNASNFTSERVASLRLVSSGGAGVTPAFVQDAAARLGARVKRTYGSTEFPTITTSSASDPDDLARTHDGRPVGVSEIATAPNGELLLRGPEGFVGYADARDNRDAFTDEGWFRTGDLATINANGWLNVVGRIKDVIIRGGENIAASEVEHHLEAHPLIRHAAAVGYPDELMGERVCAFVETDATISLHDVQAWFAELGVAKFKVPERLVVTNALPTLAAGKIDRAALRERARLLN
ncbi:MAG: class I adenylate-forming enzyme family protein [Acidimicrobiia bacterium]